METSDHISNGAYPKSQMSRGMTVLKMKKYFASIIFSAFILNSCGLMMIGKHGRRIEISSEPSGAMVYLNGNKTNKTTPAEVKARKKNCKISVRKEGYTKNDLVIKRWDKYWKWMAIPVFWPCVPFIPLDLALGATVGYSSPIPTNSGVFSETINKYGYTRSINFILKKPKGIDLLAKEVRLQKNYSEPNYYSLNNFALFMDNMAGIPVFDLLKLNIRLDTLNPVKNPPTIERSAYDRERNINYFAGSAEESEKKFNNWYSDPQNLTQGEDPLIFIPLYNNTGSKVRFRFIENPERMNRISLFTLDISSTLYDDCVTTNKWYEIASEEVRKIQFQWDIYTEAITDDGSYRRTKNNYAPGVFTDSIGLVFKSQGNTDTSYIRFSGFLLSDSEIGRIISENKTRFLAEENQGRMNELERLRKEKQLVDAKNRKAELERKASKYRIGAAFFSAEQNAYWFDYPHVKISYNEFLNWKEQFGGKKIVHQTKINDTLYEKYENTIEYIGAFEHIEEITSESNTGYEIIIKNNISGQGKLFFSDGSIVGNWFAEGPSQLRFLALDSKSIATINYADGRKLTGYWVCKNYLDYLAGFPMLVGELNQHFSEWIFLGSNSQDAENEYQRLLAKRRETANQISDEVTAEINNRNAFIEQNYTSIYSKIDSEKFDIDGGNFKRYEFVFQGNKSDGLRYYPDQDEWCKYSLGFSDYCYKEKSKALCRLYWDLTH